MEAVFKKAIAAENPMVWNAWKRKSSEELIFNGFVFSNGKFSGFDFSEVSFKNCEFKKVDFFNCDFEFSKLIKCSIFDNSIFTDCSFKRAEFNETYMDQVLFPGSNLILAKFSKCEHLVGLNFFNASLVYTEFDECIIKEWSIYGANIWQVKINKTKQVDLKIEPYSQREGKKIEDLLRVDDIEMGNIIYMLTDNSNYARLIDTSKPKSVLILGKFGDNLSNLEKIKNELRKKYSPILFNFESSKNLDYIEIIIFLALLSKYIIVDLTDARSVPAELQAILSTLMIPVIPIMQKSSSIYGTYSSTNKYNWVSNVIVFNNIDQIIKKFQKAIIDPAEEMCKKVEEIRQRKIVYQDINEI